MLSRGYRSGVRNLANCAKSHVCPTAICMSTSSVLKLQIRFAACLHASSSPVLEASTCRGSPERNVRYPAKSMMTILTTFMTTDISWVLEGQNHPPNFALPCIICTALLNYTHTSRASISAPCICIFNLAFLFSFCVSYISRTLVYDICNVPHLCKHFFDISSSNFSQHRIQSSLNTFLAINLSLLHASPFVSFLTAVLFTSRPCVNHHTGVYYLASPYCICVQTLLFRHRTFFVVF